MTREDQQQLSQNTRITGMLDAADEQRQDFVKQNQQDRQHDFDERQELNAEKKHDMQLLRDELASVKAAAVQTAELLKKNTSDTAEMLAMFATLRAGIQVLGWIGVGAKWVTSVLAVFAAIYAFIASVRGKP